MFNGCSSLTINFSTFDTLIVRNMRFMFYKGSSLIVLNLSSFETQNVTDMDSLRKF